MPWYPWHLPTLDLGLMPGGVAYNTPIATVSRFYGHTELFYIAPDGSVNVVWFYGTSEPGGTTQIAPPHRAYIGGAIVATSRQRECMEVWWTGPAGTIEHAWWYEGIQNNRWQTTTWLTAAGGMVSKLSGLAVQVHSPIRSTLYWIGEHGSMNSLRVDYSVSIAFPSTHSNWTIIAPDGSVKIGSGIAHTSRKPETQEIQWIGPNGSIENAFRYDPGGWNRFQLAAPGNVNSGRSGICGLSRKPEIMDVWWVGKDGSIQGKYWFEGIQNNAWAQHQIAPPGAADADSGLVAVSRFPHTVELWWVGRDKSVQGAYWYEPWTAYKTYQLAPPNTANPDNRLAACVQYTGGFGVYFAGRDNHLRHKFFRDVQEKAFPRDITNLTIRSDGSVWWRGNAHNSGADKYTYFVTGVVYPRDGNLPPLALTRNGRVIPTRRDDNWGATQLFQGYSSLLQSKYEEYANGRFQLYIEYTSDFSEAFQDIVGFFGKWILGSILGPGTQFVIFLAVEVGSLITTGSLVPGARVLSGILFMAGPDGTLLALGAQAIVSIGSNQRLLTTEEYDWCCNEVFGTSLPPRERIVLCDTIGKDDRPFCWPCPGGMISINIGKESFNDPRNFGRAKGRAYGETLIHELTHVWQLAHTGIDLVMLAKAISNQIRGQESYEYGPPNIKFSDFLLEAQASIVGHWAVGRAPAGGSRNIPKDELSPYYKYILLNIKPGNYS